LYPWGFEEPDGLSSPKVVSSYLLDQMADAGINAFHFVIRKGKWDIPNYYGGGKLSSKNICYQLADYVYGVPFSLNQAYSFTKGKNVAIGFPDILIKPRGVYSRLLEKLESNPEAAVVLGLFPSPDPLKWDMVEIENKSIKNIFIKTEEGKQLQFTWVVAVWRPAFSDFLNNFLKQQLQTKTETELLAMECQLSNIFLSAMKNDFRIDYVLFPEGKCFDIGTPERLRQAEQFLRQG
jgi:glucose-1-phosphate thymidylyltransferase